MILEAIVTTTNEVDAQGTPTSGKSRVNVAPMGPRVNPQLTEFSLRPFKGSQTYENLKRTRCAVIHVTDDSRIFAAAVTGTLAELPLRLLDSHSVGEEKWWVLESACRYFAVEIVGWHEDELRAEASCRVVDSGELRPFFGFNRAKHAVIEAAILATRLHLLDSQLVRDELSRLQVWVDKTAGDAEREAFARIVQHIVANTTSVNSRI